MKNKVFLMDTSFARENGLQQGVNSALRYLVDNRQVVLPQMDLNTIFQTKILSMSPTNRIFEHLLADNLMDEYCFVDTSLSSQSTPELLTITDVTVDLKQITNARVVLSSLQEFRNKMIINIAPLIKRNRDGFIKVSDINELHNQVVRGALVSSYYNCNDEIWLNPNLLKYICQTYSMCISSVLQRLYNLDVPSQMTIAAALTWFMMNRMTDAADDMTIQCDYLGSPLSIRNMIEMFKDTVDNVAQFDLVKLSNLIASIGPDHMKGFNKDIFTRAMARSGASYITMNMALEYPPYWVHQILFALSGNKVYLSNLLQKTRLLKSAGAFLQDLDTCRQFVPTVGFITKGVSSFEPNIFLMNNNVVSDTNENVKFEYNEIDNGFSGIISLLNGQYVKCIFECDNNKDYISLKQKEAYKNLFNIDTNEIYTKTILNTLYKQGAEKLTVEEAINKETFNIDNVRIGLDGTVLVNYIFKDSNGWIKELSKNIKTDQILFNDIDTDNININSFDLSNVSSNFPEFNIVGVEGFIGDVFRKIKKWFIDFIKWIGKITGLYKEKNDKVKEDLKQDKKDFEDVKSGKREKDNWENVDRRYEEYKRKREEENKKREEENRRNREEWEQKQREWRQWQSDQQKKRNEEQQRRDEERKRRYEEQKKYYEDRRKNNDEWWDEFWENWNNHQRNNGNNQRNQYQRQQYEKYKAGQSSGPDLDPEIAKMYHKQVPENTNTTNLLTQMEKFLDVYSSRFSSYLESAKNAKTLEELKQIKSLDYTKDFLSLTKYGELKSFSQVKEYHKFSRVNEIIDILNKRVDQYEKYANAVKSAIDFANDSLKKANNETEENRKILMERIRVLEDYSKLFLAKFGAQFLRAVEAIREIKKIYLACFDAQTGNLKSGRYGAAA